MVLANRRGSKSLVRWNSPDPSLQLDALDQGRLFPTKKWEPRLHLSDHASIAKSSIDWLSERSRVHLQPNNRVGERDIFFKEAKWHSKGLLSLSICLGEPHGAPRIWTLWLLFINRVRMKRLSRLVRVGVAPPVPLCFGPARRNPTPGTRKIPWKMCHQCRIKLFPPPLLGLGDFFLSRLWASYILLPDVSRRCFLSIFENFYLIHQHRWTGGSLSSSEILLSCTLEVDRSPRPSPLHPWAE